MMRLSSFEFLVGYAESLDKVAFSRSGWRFVGWLDVESGVSYKDAQEVVNLTAEDGGIVTLTVRWERVVPASPSQPSTPSTIVKTGDAAMHIAIALIAVALGCYVAGKRVFAR